MKLLIKSIIAAIFRLKMNVDSFFDRFYGLANLSLIKKQGRNCYFEGNGKLYNPELIQLGDEVSIGKNFFLRGGGKIEVGSYTHISRNVIIHTVNHNINGRLLPYDRCDIKKNVNIGRYVWIGMNVQILPGVTIGDGAVIGMGSVVSKDVAPGSIVVGYGQRVVNERNSSHTEKLLEGKCFLKNNSK
ncbi:acyltransferase [Vibrio kanaloae]|uniref:acyltransferase n=1 Tax=Vibrio kanaloae TaxID=170673 RepID=UPI0010BF60B4|nr:acyltransferase [Vibrio kanaloae]TKF80560.1 acyltransferase [Vibrio kanaloae]